MKHQCCPPEWRQTENVTGDYDFDASLEQSRQHNSDVDARLRMYSLHDSKTSGPLTGYDGYHGYRGDN